MQVVLFCLTVLWAPVEIVNACFPVLITARLASSRLPRKHLLQIAPGRTVIGCLIERLQASFDFRLVLCIPEGPDNAPLQRIALDKGIECYGGDPDNVLRRYAQAMAHLKTEAAVIVDADDLFVSAEAIQHIIEIYAGEDVIRFAGMAYGGAPYLLSLRFVHAMLDAEASPQGWSAILDRIPGKKLILHNFEVAPEEQLYRLSLDYREDFEFLQFIYHQLGPGLTHRDVIAYITTNKSALTRQFPGLFDGSMAEHARLHLAEPERLSKS